MGPLEQLERQFDSIDEVLIADPDFPQERAVELIDTCHRHGIKVRVAPSTMEILMDRVEFVPGQALPLFELKPPVFEGIDFVVKRSFDMVGAALLVLVLSPMLAAIALAVKSPRAGAVDLPLEAARAWAARRSTASSSGRCTRTPSSARWSSRS